MPLVNEEVRFKAQEANAFQNKQTNFNQNAQGANNQNQFNESQTQKGLLTLPPALMQIVPWIPFAIEAFTGQKIPAISGTIGEIQSSLTQIQFSLTQLLNNQQKMLNGQQQLWNKLESLESNASSQLTNLSQQLTNTNRDFKLLATETKRSLEFSQSQNESET